ncbi:hypothetical protein F5Y16DRAFT_360432 [Xylariaceae sp. FL0255]|nr:hypothetical protein F5Y16DRAFT_360432 [Xylariaceae sp. FL0255]
MFYPAASIVLIAIKSLILVIGSVALEDYNQQALRRLYLLASWTCLFYLSVILPSYDYDPSY